MLPVSEIAQLSERRLNTGTGKTRGSAEASAADGTAAGGEELSQEKRGEIIDIRLRIQSELLEKLSEVKNKKQKTTVFRGFLFFSVYSKPAAIGSPKLMKGT